MSDLILPKLKIYGFSEAQENAIFACLLLGEPCLLLGPPGSCKTELVKMLGDALREYSKREYPDDKKKWFGYQIYDASKLNFDDLFGYPNINKMKKDPPEVDYIETPSTIWNKEMVVFDELNRCAEDRQSNLFEILRTRCLHGIPTGNKFIFGTMNPFGDQGTLAMSDALVDRFLLYLRVGDFASMKADERTKVIARVGDIDSVGTRHWAGTREEFDVDRRGNTINHKLADIGAEITDLMLRAARNLGDLNSAVGPAINEMVSRIVAALATEFKDDPPNIQRELKVSGRRAAALKRALLAIRAIEITTSSSKRPLKEIIGTIINTTKLAVPVGISGKLNQQIQERADNIVDSTVKQVWPSLEKRKDVVNIDMMTTVLNSSDPIQMLNGLLSLDLDKITRDKVLANLLDKQRYVSSVPGKSGEDIYQHVQILLYKLGSEIPDFIPPHIKIDVTNEVIERHVSNSRIPIPDHLEKYDSIIMAELNNLKAEPVLEFALKMALQFYFYNLKDAHSAIETVAGISETLEVLKNKLALHRINKDEEKDGSNDKNTES